MKSFTITALCLMLTACRGLAEAAYDFQADKQASRCDAIISHIDRQACLARAREVERQANQVRKQ